MSNAEHGLALSDNAVDTIKWLTSDGRLSNSFDGQHATPNYYNNNWRIPLDYYYFSSPIDVRGMPDITLALVVTDGENETVAHVTIETSLNGLDWIALPENLFTIYGASSLIISILQTLFATLYLRTNFIRILLSFPGATPPLPEIQVTGTIVAGEA